MKNISTTIATFRLFRYFRNASLSVWIYEKHFSRLRPVSFVRRYDPSSKFRDKIVAHRIDQIRRTIGRQFYWMWNKKWWLLASCFKEHILYGAITSCLAAIHEDNLASRCKRTHISCMLCVNVPLFDAIGSMHSRKMCVTKPNKTKQIIKIRFRYWHVRTSQIV